MSTLFSRRPGKSRLGFGSNAAAKNNKFGTGISSTDFEQLQDPDTASLLLRKQSQPTTSPAGSNAADQLPPGSPGLHPAGQSYRPASAASHVAAKTLPSRPVHDKSPDEFGRSTPTPTQTNPRNGLPRAAVPSATVGAQRFAPKWSASSSLAVPVDGTPLPAGANALASASGKEAYPYGYTHEGWDIEMTQAVAKQIVDLCGQEIRARGLDSPLVFSSMALDLSATGVASLIRAFMRSDHARLKASPLADEVRYANPHDLAAMVKWALARLGRFYAVPVPSAAPTKKGEVQEEMAVVQQRGWLELDWYLTWREQEKGSGYPWTAFSQFCHTIDDEAAQLLRSLFSLLSSTTSYSSKNGMTPSKLSRLFGVLLFGLPEDETFTRTYEAYVRASNAAEHLLLAYIRDLAAYEVLPVRLMNHVDGYPATLSSDLSRPAKNVRTVPVTQVERLVRFYSQDLIQSACEWDLAAVCDQWAACCAENEYHGKHPQLSERFRQLIHLRGAPAQTRGLARGDSRASETDLGHGRNHGTRAQTQSEDATPFSSIIDEQWDNFLNEGFAPPDQSKLAFDLRETERKARMQKRGTLAWSDFQTLGFDSTGQDSLAAVLSFDDGLKDDMRRWPDERAELMQRLRSTSERAPPFPYDGRARVVAQPSADDTEQSVFADNGETIFTRIDDVFAEVWADYLIGNGWSNRDEPTHRSANFVVLQYKSRPNRLTIGTHKSGVASSSASTALASRTSLGDAVAPDDRVDAAWFVIQELVPSGYRADLEAAGRSSKTRTRGAIRKVKLFSRLRRDKPSASPSRSHFSPADKNASWSYDKENEMLFPPGTKKMHLSPDPATLSEPSFDLERNGTAKGSKRGMVSLFSSPLIGSTEASVDEASQQNSSSGRPGLMTSLRGKARKMGVGAGHEDAPVVPPKSPLGVSTSNGQNGGFKTTSSSFGSADFETRSLHDPEDEIAASSRANQHKSSKRRSLLKHHGRHESKDDAWVDVMTRSPRDTQTYSPSGLMPARPERTSSLVQVSVDTSENHGGSAHSQPKRTEDESPDFSPVTTPKQETVARLGHPLTPADETTKVSPVRTPVRTFAPRSPGSPRGDGASTATFVRRKPPALESDAVETARATPERPNDTPTSTLKTPSPVRGAQDEGRLSPSGNNVRTGVEMLSPPSPNNTARLSSPAPSSENSQDIDAFPAPPTRPPTETPAVGIADRNSVLSTASTEGVETIEFNLPSRTGLRPVADVSKQDRDQRVSAALNRARELRAKLQPVEGRGPPADKPANGDRSQLPQAASTVTGLPTKPKVDPFAKNPTTGKVASMAARFKESEAAVKNAASPGPVKTTPTKLQTPSTPIKKDTVQSAESLASSVPISGPDTSPLTQAALARVQGSLIDPETPPSPRAYESGYSHADNESLAPDDAASNYSRSTEDSMGGEALGTLSSSQQQVSHSTPSGGNPTRGWDKGSQAEHARQKALQSAFLGRSESSDAVESRAEEEDVSTDLPTHFAEPYRPGQPLENLLEESESMLSGSNG